MNRAQKVAIERQFLGAALVAEGVNPLAFSFKDDDFSPGFCRQLFKGMCDVTSGGGKIDPPTVLAKSLVNAVDLSRLINESGNSGNLDYYAEELRSAIIQEKQSLFRSKAAKMIADGADPKDIACRVETAIAALLSRFGKGTTSGGGVVAAEALLTHLINGGNQDSITTGIKPIDEVAFGVIGGDMVIIAARPSVGKTALALQIAKNFSLLRGMRSMYFSFEMSGVQLSNRILGSIAGESTRAVLRGGFLDTGKKERLLNYGDQLLSVMRNIDVMDRPGMTMSFIKAATREFVLSGGKAIFLDHIGLVPPEEGSKLSKRELVSSVSTGMKSLARELGVPVFVLSQLNRECESQKRGPQLSDLRDSGDLEQDADFVWFLHRQDPKNRLAVWFDQAKGRDVGVGGDALYFDPEKQIYSGVEKEDDPCP